jgi:Fe-S-cluster-containing dehydrogenase component
LTFIAVSSQGPRRVGNKWEYYHEPVVCQHCDEPPCAEVCPEAAITKREDSIVILDREQCSGCQACIDACPYNAIVFDDKEHKALKCNLCYHRVDRGLMPACADNVCPAHCIYFGDRDEMEEVIRKKKLKRQTL